MKAELTLRHARQTRQQFASAIENMKAHFDFPDFDEFAKEIKNVVETILRPAENKALRSMKRQGRKN